MMSKYFCYQANDSDCGFASLKMLMAYKCRNTNYLRITKDKKLGSYTFADLIAIANNYGFSLAGYRYEEKKNVSVKVPFLALLERNHLVVVTRLDSFKVKILDPSRGEVTLSRDDFIKSWSGDTLEIKSFKQSSFKKERIQFCSWHSKIFTYLLSISSLASLLVGFFFIQDDTYIFIPLILLGVFISIELVQKWYLIKQINLFDIKFTPIYFKENDNLNREGLIEYSEFKKICFSFENKIAVALCASAAIIVVLVINTPISVASILLILLMNVISKMLFKNSDEKRLDIINKSEDSLLNSNNASSQDIMKICNLSNKYAFNISLRNCIYSFLILLLSFFTMIASGIVSVNFIIFHFGLFYVLNTYIDTLVSYLDEKKQYERSKARFLDKCNL